MSETKRSISFIELLEGVEKVEIPIIQRDYAQGREDKAEILEEFLNAIHQKLISKTVLELDFIYGSTDNGAFQPLDGQQRLTTLFLLHWFACLKERHVEDNKDLLSRFSYETRITSREFLKALISASDLKPYSENSLKEQIIDSKWFFLSWRNDQTIESMLRAIDRIEDKFNDLEDLYKLLFSSKLIRFYNIDLENIGLTDDLYIKMNARGKLLTPFENFKASLEKKIKENNFEKCLSLENSFAFKIDTKWTDFFWEKYRSSKNVVDDSIMRVLSALIMARISIERIDNRIPLIQNLQDDSNSLRVDFISKESYEYLYQVLDLYSTNQIDLNLNLNYFRHTPNEDLLSQVANINYTSSYTNKVLFFAQTIYLINNHEVDQEKLKDWMRVIRNLVSRGNVTKGGKRPDIIRSPETFDGIINLINELSIGSSDIYSYLAKHESLSSSFSRTQIIEERAKAKLITFSDEYKKSILQMEDIHLFKGRIAFAFDCCNFDYKSPEALPIDFNLELFNNVKSTFDLYFNSDDEDISNDIRRALLTIEIDNQSFYEYWWSYWYVADSEKRCLIENFNEVEYFIYYTEYSGFLKELIKVLTKTSLDTYLNEFQFNESTPNWKRRLVKEKELLDKHCRSRYIAINYDENKCYLLRSQRPRDTEGSMEVI